MRVSSLPFAIVSFAEARAAVVSLIKPRRLILAGIGMAKIKRHAADIDHREVPCQILLAQ